MPKLNCVVASNRINNCSRRRETPSTHCITSKSKFGSSPWQLCCRVANNADQEIHKNKAQADKQMEDIRTFTDSLSTRVRQIQRLQVREALVIAISIKCAAVGSVVGQWNSASVFWPHGNRSQLSRAFALQTTSGEAANASNLLLLLCLLRPSFHLILLLLHYEVGG